MSQGFGTNADVFLLILASRLSFYEKNEKERRIVGTPLSANGFVTLATQ
jgi:hypothetical protein